MPSLGCGKLSGCDIRQSKNLDVGVSLLYLCNSEVRLHLCITFENKFSSSAFGLHWHCNNNKGCTAALISCTWALTDEKTVFLIDSFSVLRYFVTTESKTGRPVWNPGCVVEFYHTILRLSQNLGSTRKLKNQRKLTEKYCQSRFCAYFCKLVS